MVAATVVTFGGAGAVLAAVGGFLGTTLALGSVAAISVMTVVGVAAGAVVGAVAGSLVAV
ncbi:MAG: hypothetical protein ACI4OP_00615 [Candidatus Coprovivens sp.]